MKQKKDDKKHIEEKYETISDKEFMEAVEEVESRYGKMLDELARE